MNKWTVTLNMGNLSETIREITERLKSDTKATKAELQRTELLVEETFLRMKNGMGGGDDFAITIFPRRSWGDTELCLTVKGVEFNPLPSMNDMVESDFSNENFLSLAILRWNRLKMAYARRNQVNQVSIKVHELDSNKKQLYRTLAGLVLGVITGLLMQMFLDQSTLSTFDKSVITPFRDMFMNALKMMMAPVTFFAVIAGVSNISDTALLGKMGGKLFGVSLFMQLLTAFLGLSLALLLFSGDLSYMRAGILSSEGGAAITTQYPSLTDLFFDIVPKDIVDPFRGENILQVMFLAIFFGIVIKKMGNKSKAVNDCIDFMFRFVLTTLKIIVTTIPLIVFLSMASLLANTGLDSLIAFSSLFVGLAIGVVLVWCVGAFTTLLFGRITPIHLSRKLIGLSPLVFSVSSSHARLIFVLKFCTEKLGIDSNLSAFSIPVGVQLNKAGNCIFFSLVTLMMMRVYNIELTPALFIILLISVCIMAIAKPPVPCGGIICIAYLFTVVGVPPEAISVILCVDPIAAMFNGVSNESANITTSFILAKTNSMLDKEKYFAR